MNASRHLCIEPYKAHLLEAVVALNAAAFSAQWGERWSDSDMRSALSLKNMELLLAGDGDQDFFGFLLARTVADEAEILLIGVLPEHRHNGIGSLLIEAFVQQAQEGGYTKLFLEVRETNTAARKLYCNAGFRKIGHRKDYYLGIDGQKSSAITLARYFK
ncbi:MAG: ribosomal protein S18-alanine N-acetyltransferase [Pseudomonadota bacterium]